jgi:enediyne biosynthesis protein E4
MITSSKRLSVGVSLPLGVLLSVSMAATASGKTVQPESFLGLNFENVANRLGAFELNGFSFMPGVAVIDYNNDAYQDIYVANGLGQPNALFRNNKNGTFTEVANAAGVADRGQGTGLAVGDINNDGCDDLYVGNGSTVGDGLDSNDGPDRLYLNNCRGVFVDIAARAGIFEEGFTSSVAMADYDGDGDLDIMVGRWIDFDFNPANAGRDVVPAAPSHLYRNNGNLTFTDVTAEANVVTAYNTWSIAWLDYDDDADVDLFLGTERGPIDVFRNNGNGRFTKVTQQSGDLSAYGAWMGLTVGDYDGDGRFDLFGTNISDLRITRSPSLPALVVPPPDTWDNPRPTVFRNNGNGTFSDVGAQTINSMFEQFSWGCAFEDFNNDSFLDLFVSMNMAPVGVIGREAEGAGPSKLHLNNGNGSFTDVTFAAGLANFGPDGNYLDGRGMVTLDFDKDGRMDYFQVNAPQFVEGFPFGRTPIAGKGLPKFFRNSSDVGDWLELRLIGAPGTNHNAVGAKVKVTTRDGRSQIRTVGAGTSAFSAPSRILHFGLADQNVLSVEVRWPNGSTQQYGRLGKNKIWTLVQGESKPIAESRYERDLAR